MNTETVATERSVDAVKRLARGELSRARRMLYVLLLLLDAGGVVLTVALWSTEPGLPLRTHLAFGGLVSIALAWLIFFCWVLAARRPLYAIDRVAAGRLAVAATALFLVGGGALAVQRGGWQGVATVGGIGGAFLGVAVALLVHAVRLRRSLLKRRGELETQLREGSAG